MKRKLSAEGYFQGLMDRLIKNKYISIIIAGFLFAVIHMINPINGFAKMDMFQIIIRLGYYASFHGFFNLVKKETKSLAASTVVHTVFNFLVFV